MCLSKVRCFRLIARVKPVDFVPLSRFPKSKMHGPLATQRDTTTPLVLAVMGGMALLTLLLLYGGAVWLFLGLPALALYLLPSIIAAQRNAPRLVGIVALNVLAGWSIIGWVAALWWAVSHYQRDR